jgi:hypothetical protein
MRFGLLKSPEIPTTHDCMPISYDIGNQPDAAPHNEKAVDRREFKV